MTALQGAARGAQVVASLTATVVCVDVIGRRSATQFAGAGSVLQFVPSEGKVVMSTIRKRSLVMAWPRLLVNRPRKERVPKLLVEELPGVVSRKRLGATSSGAEESR